jgi:hypothetical protein
MFGLVSKSNHHHNKFKKNTILGSNQNDVKFLELNKISTKKKSNY